MPTHLLHTSIELEERSSPGTGATTVQDAGRQDGAVGLGA
jgi:hypothetical protein